MAARARRPAVTDGGVVVQGRLAQYGAEPDATVDGRDAFLEGVDLKAARSGLVVWTRFADTGVLGRHSPREVTPRTPFARKTVRAAARLVAAAAELECRLGMAPHERDVPARLQVTDAPTHGAGDTK